MIIGTAAQAAALLAPVFASGESEKVAVLHLGEDQRLIGITFEGAGEAVGVELPVGAILSSALDRSCPQPPERKSGPKRFG
jgi:hypothetical protein